MQAWAKDQGVPAGSIIKLLADTGRHFTDSLGLVLDHPGPMGKLGSPRCKRFSMIVKDCKVKTLNVAEAENDPAGDDFPEVSMPEKILEDLAAGKDEL